MVPCLVLSKICEEDDSSCRSMMLDHTGHAGLVVAAAEQATEATLGFVIRWTSGGVKVTIVSTRPGVPSVASRRGAVVMSESEVEPTAAVLVLADARR